MIHVLVNGASGRMGSEVVRSILGEDDLDVCGAVDPGTAGHDLGEIVGTGANGITIVSSLQEAFAVNKPDVVVDFTSPKVIFDNANGLVAPNFSLGAVLLMKLSAEVAKYMPNVEIIELHHNKKYDAPSGTAKLTAEKIADARVEEPEEDLTKESLPGARGGKYKGVTIHSVRLPGYVAHQEVLFGGYGELLTLRHDSLDRKSFMPGVMMACRKVMTTDGFVYGLENYLE